MNYDQITSRIWVGSGPVDANDIQDLINHGITAIIDVRQLDDNTLVLGAERSELVVLYNPTLDDGSPKPVSWFKTTYDFCIGHRDAVFYFHCDAGINRGPSSAAFWMMSGLGLFKQDVVNIIHNRRPITILGLRYIDDAEAAVKSLGL